MVVGGALGVAVGWCHTPACGQAVHSAERTAPRVYLGWVEPGPERTDHAFFCTSSQACFPWILLVALVLGKAVVLPQEYQSTGEQKFHLAICPSSLDAMACGRPKESNPFTLGWSCLDSPKDWKTQGPKLH